ncbi:hypothetical protein AFB00_13375 [Pseudonocardia sp. HH130630-07]|nr:hypothetical protein AFB00_13375 [Pseudonocardia sp. HH130630-07]
MPRPTRVVPGPGVPPGTPPGGQPGARPAGAAAPLPATGPGGPNGPVGGDRPGPGGGTAAASPSPTTAAGGETTSLKADLSPTKIAAGAGAAIVTAILGSFLGAVGTIVGAALGSIISTLATTLFTRSIEVSRNKALEIKDKAAARKGRGVAGTVAAAGHPGGPSGSTGEETVLLDPSQAPGQPSGGRGGWRRVRVTRRTVIVAAVLGLVTFGVSMFLITGIEVVKGSSLAGTSSGTSVGRVVSGPPPAEPADDGSGSTGGSESTTESSESSTSSSSETSTDSTGSSTGESGEQTGENGSRGENPLQEGLNRVLPTQQPESGRQQSDRSGQDGEGSSN